MNTRTETPEQFINGSVIGKRYQNYLGSNPYCVVVDRNYVTDELSFLSDTNYSEDFLRNQVASFGRVLSGFDRTKFSYYNNWRFTNNNTPYAAASYPKHLVQSGFLNRVIR